MSQTHIFGKAASNKEANAFLRTAVDSLRKNASPCFLCGNVVDAGHVGMGRFEKEAAELAGAPKGKSRMYVYKICLDCGDKFPSFDVMAEAADAEFIRSLHEGDRSQ